jgi:hypothetical protein
MKAWPAAYLKGGNKKVKGATKTVLDGISFDSKLEAFMFSLLKMHKIKHELQKEYLLQESFIYDGETVRPMIMTLDFFLPDMNILIDTKGWANDSFAPRLKMLKWRLKSHYKTEPQIELPSTKKECESLVLEILNKLSKTRK